MKVHFIKGAYFFLFSIPFLFVCYLGYLYFRPESFEEIMERPSMELNKQCPMMIDANTRFDSGVILKNRTYQYSYTILDTKKEELMLSDLIVDVKPLLIERVKNSPDMKILRDNKANVLFTYYDKNSDFLFSLMVEPADYND